MKTPTMKKKKRKKIFTNHLKIPHRKLISYNQLRKMKKQLTSKQTKRDSGRSLTMKILIKAQSNKKVLLQCTLEA